MKKYEITDIAHPDYPWLHRIRALTAFREDVRPGQLGGYVQDEDNLSQDGQCWIFGDALVCEDAHISGNAIVCGKVWVHGHCLVFGRASILDNATVCDHAIVSEGIIRDCAFVGGEARIYEHRETKRAPIIGFWAKVYGEVSGHVQCGAYTVILPGMKVINPTPDRFRMDHHGIQVDISPTDSGRHLEPPEGFTFRTPKQKTNPTKDYFTTKGRCH